MRSLFIVECWVGACLLASCATFSAAEGKALTERSTKLEERIAVLEQEAEALRDEQNRVAETTGVSRRASADVGAQLSSLGEQVGTLDGQLAELKEELRRANERADRLEQSQAAQVQNLQRRAGIDPPINTADIPASKEDHKALIKKALEDADYARVRGFGRPFVERYADDKEHAAEVQYWIGVSLLRERRASASLGEFRVVLSRFNTAAIMPSVLLEMSDAFYELHACTDARDTLNTLVRTYPRSTETPKAREKLRKISASPRGYCTS